MNPKANHRQKYSKIAIVEDDADMRLMLEDFLHMQGLQTVTFANPEEFLREARSSHWQNLSVLVSDIYMPKLSGIDLLKATRIENPQLPVILITASPNSRDEALAQSLGTATVLRKPFPLKDFLEQVEKFSQSPLPPSSSRRQAS